MIYLAVFLFSIIFTLILTFVLSKVYYKFWLLDNPQKYWYKRPPIPYSLWVIFYINFLVSSLLFIDLNDKLVLILLFWFIITLISFFDDKFEVSPKIRLCVQFIIWFIIALTSINIWYVSNIFWWIINLETYNFEILWSTFYILPIIFTIFWYILILNALNWSDWVRWVTTWISWISYLIILLLSVKLLIYDNYEWAYENSQFIILMSTILIWSVLTFWYFDYKEKALMWDSWTMFLWFMLATLAIISGWKIATVSVVFWVYLIDAFYVIFTRIKSKKSPLNKDFTHLHHRLKSIWLTKNEILTYIYSLSLIFWLCSLFLDKSWKILLFFIIAIVVIFLSNILDRKSVV